MPSDKISDTSHTSCKECIFAIYKNKTQIGCLDNRIEKFKNNVVAAYDDDKEFYVINRACTLYRPETWNGGEKNLQKAKEECEIKFDILINCDNINVDMLKYIQNIAKSASSGCKINIFYSYNLEHSQKELIKNIIYNCPNINISMYLEKIKCIYSILSKSKGMFHIILDETNYVGILDFIANINKAINDDLIKGIIFKQDNKIAISTLACRLLYPNLYMDYKINFTNVEAQIKESNLYIEF